MNSGQFLRWSCSLFPSFGHMKALLKRRTPDILVTHWHDTHSLHVSAGDDYRSGPGEIVSELRRQRGSALKRGPFVVGEYTSFDRRFRGSSGRDRIIQMLDWGYDMLFERPLEPNILPWNIAIGLWNLLLVAPMRHRFEAVPFDPLFVGYLRGFNSNTVRNATREIDEATSRQLVLDQARLAYERDRWLRERADVQTRYYVPRSLM